MKKLALAVSILAISAISASAADMAPRYTKAAPMVAAAYYDWSGFYIGANAGYGWARDDHADLTTFGGNFTNGTSGPFGGRQRVNPQGGVLGGQAGYNWQSANWVIGLEIAGDGTDLRRTDKSIFFPLTDTLQSQINGTFTATGRIGYAFNNWLPYIKGGYAGTELETRNFSSFLIGGVLNQNALSQSAWRDGYTIGGGVEYGITPNWTAGVEYSYMDFGSRTLNGTSTGTSGGPETFNDGLRISTITARLNYRFGSPAVARY